LQLRLTLRQWFAAATTDAVRFAGGMFESV
jgi:hypothetical protein